MTLQECQQIIRNKGHKNSSCDWENEENIYAFSFKTVPNTYGHPELTVHYDKVFNTLTVC